MVDGGAGIDSWLLRVHCRILLVIFFWYVAGSAGGSERLPWLGPTGAGSIVELLALGVAISNADWRERVGEAGGERS